jgi:hypothetical protein
MVSKRQPDPGDGPRLTSEPLAPHPTPRKPGAEGHAQARALQRLRERHVTRIRKLIDG